MKSARNLTKALNTTQINGDFFVVNHVIPVVRFWRRLQDRGEENIRDAERGQVGDDAFNVFEVKVWAELNAIARDWLASLGRWDMRVAANFGSHISPTGWISIIREPLNLPQQVQGLPNYRLNTECRTSMSSLTGRRHGLPLLRGHRSSGSCPCEQCSAGQLAPVCAQFQPRDCALRAPGGSRGSSLNVI